MEYESPNIETRQALDDLQRYLSDRVAPLMVSDSLTLLMERPPELVANQIHAWTTGQYRGVGATSGISPASYFFHALKKLHLVGEFRLVPHADLESFVRKVADILVEKHCPGEEKQLLQDNIALLGSTETVDSSTVEILHRPSGATPVGSMGPGGGGSGGGPGGGGAPLSTEEARGFRRFSLLLDRLVQVPQAPLASGVTIPENQVDVLSQLLTTAVVGSHTQSELDQYFSRLREMGMEPRTDQVFRVLARGLPGWGIVIPQGAVAAGGAPPQGAVTPGATPSEGPIEAMHRLITITKDPEEGAKRFNEMVQAAIEQFNEGALAPAVAMFDLADRILTEKQVQENVARSILQRSHEVLDPVRLGKLADKPEKHPMLRRVLNFFPAMTPRGLLEDLAHEPKREKRKLLLALLEVHGQAARTIALEDLRASLEGKRMDIDSFHQRNLVYMLRRVPRGPGESVDEEINLVLRLCGSQTPPIVRKEAIATLGQIKHERAENALIGLMREFEERLVHPQTSNLDRQELVLLLDRTVYALTRCGTPATWRAVIDHGLRPAGALGDPTARLANLAGLDLSEDKESVARLTKALRDHLPVRVLGFLVSKRDDRVSYLIKALSTTPAAPVRHALEEIVKRYQDQEFAKLAEKTLQGFGAILRPHDAPATTLSGDLELFGLPNLLQTLAESHVTGALSLMDAEGESIGVLHLEDGMFRNCQVGILRGDEAVYQLFEKPVPGTFALRSRRDGSHDSEQTEPPRDVLPVVLEACRRYDEFRKARALVPDEAALKPTGSKPTRTVDESDIGFLRALWTRITSGATPVDCERAIAADSYRIRSLLAHWLETGALAVQQRT